MNCVFPQAIRESKPLNKYYSIRRNWCHGCYFLDSQIYCLGKMKSYFIPPFIYQQLEHMATDINWFFGLNAFLKPSKRAIWLYFFIYIYIIIYLYHAFLQSFYPDSFQPGSVIFLDVRVARMATLKVGKSKL